MGKGLEMTALSEGSLQGRRVLVAEDEGPTRWSYVGLFRNAGARVTEARDGVEALELARNQPPDVIVADVAMPRLDGLGLCAALRREPALAGVSVVLLSDGAPPQAVWGAKPRSRPLVDAVLAALASHAPAAEGPPSGVRPSARQEQSAEDQDDAGLEHTERENIRAQSMVAMHREPANRVSRGLQAVWRLRASGADHEPGSTSGFGLEVRAASRLFGVGFLMLLAGTIGLLSWQAFQTPEVIEAPVTVVTPTVEPAVEPRAPARGPVPALAPEPGRAPAPVPGPAASGDGVGAFSGVLRPGVDPTLGASPAQGALEIDGPVAVRVEVDGADLGALPIAVALDEGRHVVRYRFETRSIDRVYYVKPGATRALHVITRPGGFVDAR